jgi:hypothetical protein
MIASITTSGTAGWTIYKLGSRRASIHLSTLGHRAPHRPLKMRMEECKEARIMKV